MNYWQDNTYFDYISDLLESSYAAINYLSWQARVLCECYDNKVLHSEALYWICTGVVPDSLATSRVIHSELDNLLVIADQFMSYIHDQDVVESVKQSLISCYTEHHLIYNYTNIKEPERRSRIRILVRMLWLPN